MKRVIFIISAAFLSGCVSYYKLPATVSSATIEIETNFRPVEVQVFEAERCQKTKYGNRLSYILPPFGDELSNNFKSIEAEKDIALTFRHFSMGTYSSSSCTASLIFHPRSDKEYKAEFRRTKEGCKLYFFRKKIINGVEKLVAEDTIKNPKELCFNG